MRTPARVDAVDAGLWLVSTSLLLLVPIGAVSGDGLAYAARAAAGEWSLNPNHLLLDPAGVLWHRLLAALGSARPVVDELKQLSIAAGAVAAALFRWSVAARVAHTRGAANHATTWLVLGSGYSRLLVSDELHMIQMPALVALAAALCRYHERPDRGRAFAIGAAAGMAALFVISNALLGVVAALVIGVVHARRRDAATVLLGLAVTAGSLLVPIGWTEARDRSVASWIFAYSGGATPARTSLVYGTQATAASVGLAGARAVYGAANTLVDLAPAVALWRDERAPLRAAVIVLAWLLAAAVFLRGCRVARSHAGVLLQAVWWPAVLGFGLYWNNSDQQFYVQLAIPLAALVACVPTPLRAAPGVLLCSTLALAWNAGDLLRRFVLYPRAENTAALLRATSGACLVVIPGYDEADNLLQLDNRARLRLTDLAVATPADVGLRELAARVGRCLASEGRVDLVEVVDGAPQQPPWKFLDDLGYRREDVLGALHGGRLDPAPRRAGTLRVRSLHAR